VIPREGVERNPDDYNFGDGTDSHVIPREGVERQALPGHSDRGT